MKRSASSTNNDELTVDEYIKKTLDEFQRGLLEMRDDQERDTERLLLELQERTNDDIVITSYAKIEGTLKTLSSPTMHVQYLRSVSNFEFPSNITLVETNVYQALNTFPTAIAVRLSKVNSNNKCVATTGDKCDLILGPLMRELTSHSWKYVQQPISIADDEPPLELDIVQRHESGLVEIANPSRTLKLLKLFKKCFKDAPFKFIENTPEIANNNKLVRRELVEMVHEYAKIKKLPAICDPNEFFVIFAREDGGHDCCDVAGGKLNPDTQYHASFMLERRYKKIHSSFIQ